MDCVETRYLSGICVHNVRRRKGEKRKEEKKIGNDDTTIYSSGRGKVILCSRSGK